MGDFGHPKDPNPWISGDGSLWSWGSWWPKPWNQSLTPWILTWHVKSIGETKDSGVRGTSDFMCFSTNHIQIVTLTTWDHDIWGLEIPRIMKMRTSTCRDHHGHHEIQGFMTSRSSRSRRSIGRYHGFGPKIGHFWTTPKHMIEAWHQESSLPQDRHGYSKEYRLTGLWIVGTHGSVLPSCHTDHRVLRPLQNSHFGGVSYHDIMWYDMTNHLDHLGINIIPDPNRSIWGTGFEDWVLGDSGLGILLVGCGELHRSILIPGLTALWIPDLHRYRETTW